MAIDVHKQTESGSEVYKGSDGGEAESSKGRSGLTNS